MVARPVLLSAIALALTSLALTSLALSGCARRDPVPPPPAETDPAVAQAGNAPILTDPDLVSLDKRFAVMADPGALDASLPPDDFALEIIAAARVEAAKLIAGSTSIAVAAGGGCARCDGALLAQRAAVLGAACSVGLEEDLAWALRLPGDLPIYPKAHLREAVGRADGSCPLRGASFTAPVPASQVLAFYRAIAAKAGFSLRQAGPSGLIGRRGGTARIAVLVRPQPGGLAHFDLLIAG